MTTEHSKHDISRSILKSDASDLNSTVKFDQQIPDAKFDLGPFTRFQTRKNSQIPLDSRNADLVMTEKINVFESRDIQFEFDRFTTQNDLVAGTKLTPE